MARLHVINLQYVPAVHARHHRIRTKPRYRPLSHVHEARTWPPVPSRAPDRRTDIREDGSLLQSTTMFDASGTRKPIAHILGSGVLAMGSYSSRRDCTAGQQPRSIRECRVHRNARQTFNGCFILEREGRLQRIRVLMYRLHIRKIRLQRHQ